jgi:hypothetical protein
MTILSVSFVLTNMSELHTNPVCLSGQKEPFKAE